MECFFLNFDKRLVQRARSKDKFNFEYTQPFTKENLFRVQIVDTNKCFKEIPDRIPFYADFIKEAYSPSYSIEEKVDFLNDTIRNLHNKINELSRYNELIIKKLDTLLFHKNESSSKNLRDSQNRLKFEKPKNSKGNKNNPKDNKEKDSKTENVINPKQDNQIIKKDNNQNSNKN